MSDLLSESYEFVKAMHIVSVIAWMAALFYLPRLFVYHAEQVGQEGKTHDLFLTMESKLAKVIMRPAAASSWLFGVLLILTPGIVDWSMIWPWSKAVAVIGMTLFHGFLESRVKSFKLGHDRLSGRQYRMLNEVPTLLMLIIVFSVVMKF